LAAKRWVVLSSGRIKRLRNKKSHGGCCRKCRRMSTSEYRRAYHRWLRRETKASIRIDPDKFSQPKVRMDWDISATMHSRGRP